MERKPVQAEPWVLCSKHGENHGEPARFVVSPEAGAGAQAWVSRLCLQRSRNLQMSFTGKSRWSSSRSSSCATRGADNGFDGLFPVKKHPQ